MNIYEAIYLRKTVRDFNEKDIDEDIIRKIIDAGLQAPTNNHMRQWEFIIIKDKASRLKVIDKIVNNTTKEDSEKIIDKWGMTDQLQREMYIEAIPKQYQMLLTAGCLIIPCFYQSKPLLKPSNLSDLNSFASIWCCIENILLTAASEGIFGVTRIPFDKEIEHLREVLKIPEDYEFPCYLALGYPDENVKQIRQHEIKAEDRMHFNKW
ncbi:UNVERIFIED_CONTAM: nitroreductase [Acetivibrio alkalicellulosi]